MFVVTHGPHRPWLNHRAVCPPEYRIVCAFRSPRNRKAPIAEVVNVEEFVVGSDRILVPDLVGESYHAPSPVERRR